MSQNKPYNTSIHISLNGGTKNKVSFNVTKPAVTLYSSVGPIRSGLGLDLFNLSLVKVMVDLTDALNSQLHMSFNGVSNSEVGLAIMRG